MDTRALPTDSPSGPISLSRIGSAIQSQPTVLLAVALMAVIVMMILPVPAWLLDAGLAASFGLAILIFTVTLFVERPLDFSSFPTVLLASLMLRLSLNVSSTKLIIGDGHLGTHAAGEVIEGFATFIMSGSVFLGLVVFCVLLIVNFVVITKGAARMAEVGARFALDGMPGKQLAIDSDMSAGAIDHEEAKRRRETEQAETTFFGSLDGASKFVKGDAIAGLLIILLNLVMGLATGVILKGMPFGTAFETYAILTVGDGLVSQIPAVIISIAAALLLARSGAIGKTDTALATQLGRYPQALGTVAALMAVFGLVPGLPFLPFALGAALLGGLAILIARRRLPAVKNIAEDPGTAVPPKESLGDILDLDEIHVSFAPDLVGMILRAGDGLSGRIDSMRRHVAREYGLILPEVRLTDDALLPASEYAISIQGARFAGGRLQPERLLVLTQDGVDDGLRGETVREPVYGAPARWVPPEEREAAAAQSLTVVEPSEVLATHLLEVIKGHLGQLLTARGLRRLLEEMTNLQDPTRAEANRKLFDELIPDRVPLDLLLSVLKLLLSEQVSIRNLPLIIEAVADARRYSDSLDDIYELVRQRLGFQILAGLRRQDGSVPLLQLDAGWEARFSEFSTNDEGRATDVALPPDDFRRLTENTAKLVGEAAGEGSSPAIVTSTKRRRFLRTVLASKGVLAPVVSFDELAGEQNPALVGTIPA